MSEGTKRDTEFDNQLREWRQGDAILSAAIPFVHIANYDWPLTDQAREAATDPTTEGALGTVATEVPGFVVLSQTCDLVKPCSKHPYIEIAPLAEVKEEELEFAKKGRLVRFAYIPELADKKLVADLHRVMTVEKTVLALVLPEERVHGCRDEAEARAFARALANKHGRFAFPDEFIAATRKIRNRIIEKIKATTSEGETLRQFYDIRVSASPSWEAKDIDLNFLFIFKTSGSIPKDAINNISQLMKRFTPTGKFKDPSFQAVTLETMSAASYFESDQLTHDELFV